MTATQLLFVTSLVLSLVLYFFQFNFFFRFIFFSRTICLFRRILFDNYFASRENAWKRANSYSSSYWNIFLLTLEIFKSPIRQKLLEHVTNLYWYNVCITALFQIISINFDSLFWLFHNWILISKFFYC